MTTTSSSATAAGAGLATGLGVLIVSRSETGPLSEEDAGGMAPGVVAAVTGAVEEAAASGIAVSGVEGDEFVSGAGVFEAEAVSAGAFAMASGGVGGVSPRVGRVATGTDADGAGEFAAGALVFGPVAVAGEVVAGVAGGGSPVNTESLGPTAALPASAWAWSTFL
jgi:hypothetical protein